MQDLRSTAMLRLLYLFFLLQEFRNYGTPDPIYLLLFIFLLNNLVVLTFFFPMDIADIPAEFHDEIWVEFMPDHVYCFLTSPEKS